MVCVHIGCHSTRIGVIDSREDERNPKRFGGLNVKRRKRKCQYGHTFWTIELPEQEFEYLRSERGRLEAPMGGVRSRE